MIASSFCKFVEVGSWRWDGEMCGFSGHGSGRSVCVMDPSVSIADYVYPATDKTSGKMFTLDSRVIDQKSHSLILLGRRAGVREKS